MSEKYQLNCALPFCRLESSKCGCATHQSKANAKACHWLVDCAKAALMKIRDGLTIDVKSMTEEWEKNATIYTFEKLPRLAVEAMLSNEPDMDDSVMLALIMRKDSMTSQALRKTVVNKVERVSYGESTLIRKSITVCEEEVLIHNQLCHFLSNQPLLAQLIPRFIMAERGVPPYSLTYYMEDVKGRTLREAIIDKIDPDEVIILLSVLHGFLDLLHRTLSFLHGDLNLDNIVLRENDEGVMYGLPLFLEDGEMIVIESRFCPVLIDFGHSSTQKHCYASHTCYPYRSTLRDVYMLYKPYAMYFSILDEESAIGHACKELARIFGEEWWKGPDYILPLPIRCEALSHRVLLDLHLKRIRQLFIEDGTVDQS